MTTEFINNLKEKTKTAKEKFAKDLIVELGRHDNEIMKWMKETANKGKNSIAVSYLLPSKYRVLENLESTITNYYQRPDLEIEVRVSDDIAGFRYFIVITW